MKSASEVQVKKFDSIKWTLVVLLIAAIVVGNSYFSEISILYRVLGIVALSIVALLIAWQTNKGVAFVEMAKKARIEIRKVVWPTRQETTQTTLLVLAAVFIVAFALWLIDLGLGWLIKTLIY